MINITQVPVAGLQLWLVPMQVVETQRLGRSLTMARLEWQQ